MIWPFVGLAAALAVGLYMFLAPGPRRRRSFRRAMHALHLGDWQRALRQLEAIAEETRASRQWQKRLRQALHECHYAGCQYWIHKREYERAFLEAAAAAEDIGDDPAAAKNQVVEAMLADMHRLYSQGEFGAVVNLAQRIERAVGDHPEALFWSALAGLQQRQDEAARESLERAVAANDELPTEARIVDPLIYLAAIHLQQHNAKAAIELLSKANRLAPSPLATTLLAKGLLGTGGDISIAVRSLQRVLERLAPRDGASDLIWLEALPEKHSAVRRYCARHQFVCPIWGVGAEGVLRIARAALAEAYYRRGEFSEAKEIYHRLARERAPSVEVLRGLGMTLVHLEEYDEAFKHLKAAYELESPKSHLTAGYLALCGTLARPAQPEAKIENIKWALWLIRDFSVARDKEWCSLLNRIFAEARSHGVPISETDQIHLCDHLLSVDATDAAAAEAYLQLIVEYPRAFRPEYAYLYCRAVQEHGLRHERGLLLFKEVLERPREAAEFFSQRGWDFADFEYYFLRQTALERPGEFPQELGPDAAERGSTLLLDRIRRCEQAGDIANAIEAAGTFVSLAPATARAYDELARLYYRSGEVDRAIDTLARWHAALPEQWQPLRKMAVLLAHAGRTDEAIERIDQALPLAPPRHGAELALLAAKIVISSRFGETARNGEPRSRADTVAAVLPYLRRAAQGPATAPTAVAVMLALGISLEESHVIEEALQSAERLDSAGAVSLTLLQAIGRLLLGEAEQAQQVIERIGEHSPASGEAEYVRGWIALARGDQEGAIGAMRNYVTGRGGTSWTLAAALLGVMYFKSGRWEQARAAFDALDEETRSRLGLRAVQRSATLLAAADAFERGDFSGSTESLQRAIDVGWRDERANKCLCASLWSLALSLLSRHSAEPGSVVQEGSR